MKYKYKNAVLYSIESGRLRIIKEEKVILRETLQPINEEDSVHFRVMQENTLLDFFFNKERFNKNFTLPEGWNSLNVFPFVMMQEEDDEV